MEFYHCRRYIHRTEHPPHFSSSRDQSGPLYGTQLQGLERKEQTIDYQEDNGIDTTRYGRGSI